MIVSFIRFFSVAQHWIRLVYSSNCHEFLVTIFAGQKYRLCINNAEYFTCCNISDLHKGEFEKCIAVDAVRSKVFRFFPVKGTATGF